MPGQRDVQQPERGGELGADQRTGLEDHLQQVVEALVERDLRVEGHDEVDPDEHLEEPVVGGKVDRAGRLRVGARPVEERRLALPPHGQLHLERAVALPVVVHHVDEAHRLGGDVAHDDGGHGVAGALQQRVAGPPVGVDAEAGAEVLDACGRGAARGHEGHQVGLVHLGGARVVEDDLENVGVQPILGEELDRRYADALVPDGGGRGGHAAGHRAAAVQHVAEHRGIADPRALVVDGGQHQPVRRVLDGAAAEVGVALEDDVARADLVVEGFQQQRHVGTELAHEHVPGGVGHEREFVVLLPDDGRHRRLQDDGVHLLADVQQRALDDLEGCQVHCGCRVGHRWPPGMIRRFSQASVAAT